MAIILKNPMPLSGALFVTNPRKKKRKSVKRRRNAGQPRSTAKYIDQAAGGLTVSQVNAMSKDEFKAAVDAGYALKREATAKKKAWLAANKKKSSIDYLKEERKGKKMHTASPQVMEAILARMSDTTGEAARYVRKRTGKAAPAKKSSRLSALKKRHEALNRKATGLFSGMGRTRKKKAKAEEKDFSEILGFASMSGMSPEDLIANPWYGAKGPQGGHAGAAYMRWGPKSRGRRLLKRYHASRKKSAAAASAAAGKGKYQEVFAIVAEEFAGRPFSSSSARMKAVHKETKKRIKKGSSSRRTASQRRATASTARKAKLNDRAKVFKQFGGLGLSSKQLGDIYELKAAATERQFLKKQIKALKKKRGETAKAFQKRVRKYVDAQLKTDDFMRDIKGRKVFFNPKKRRKNGMHKGKKLFVAKNPRRRKSISRRKNGVVQKSVSLVKSLPSKVKKFPLVGTLANSTLTPVIVPIVGGLAIYAVHTTLEPVVIPQVVNLVKATKSLPIVGGVLSTPADFTADAIASNPYASLGLIVAGLSALAARKTDLLSAKGATLLGGAAVFMGVGLDKFMKPVAKAAGEVAVESAVEAVDILEEGGAKNGFGDGGAYMIGSATPAQGYAGVHMSGIDHEYSDALMIDAFACSDVMHPDEVSALLAGEQYWCQKFDRSPGRTRKSPHEYSRHAGRPGHRFGWLIKMVGFKNVQKIAALPHSQRSQVIHQLRQQAMEMAPKLVEQAQRNADAQLETASLPLDNSFNGAIGFQDVGFGSLIFAGSDY